MIGFDSPRFFLFLFCFFSILILIHRFVRFSCPSASLLLFSVMHRCHLVFQEGEESHLPLPFLFSISVRPITCFCPFHLPSFLPCCTCICIVVVAAVVAHTPTHRQFEFYPSSSVSEFCRFPSRPSLVDHSCVFLHFHVRLSTDSSTSGTTTGTPPFTRSCRSSK